jgi:hypothetical protein
MLKKRKEVKVQAGYGSVLYQTIWISVPQKVKEAIISFVGRGRTAHDAYGIKIFS